MRRILSLLIAMAFLSAPASSSKLQDALRARWSGAWVITTVDIYSDCDQKYTDNAVNGRLVSGKGAARFAAGELARVGRIDLERSRIDVFLDIEEPLLRPFQDGPFSLYRVMRCQVELRVNIPRERVKDGDLSAAEEYLAEVFERYPTSVGARASATWNSRLRQPLPEDYEETLKKYRRWKFSSRIDDAIAQAGKALASVSRDPSSSQGLTAGITAMRQILAGKSCEELVRSSLKDYLRDPSSAADRAFYQGALLGQHLTYHLELARVLRGCLQ